MLTPSPRKKDARTLSVAMPTGDASVELKFISELGRSLHFTVHPKKVAGRVAEAIQNGVDACVCVVVAELKSVGWVSCASHGSGEVEHAFLDRAKFEKWLNFMPPQIGYSEEAADEFFIHETEHAHEYISPPHINGEIKGAVIVGFSNKGEFTERKERLIDAATQMAAMSLNLSAHYE